MNLFPKWSGVSERTSVRMSAVIMYCQLEGKVSFRGQKVNDVVSGPLVMEETFISEKSHTFQRILFIIVIFSGVILQN